MKLIIDFLPIIVMFGLYKVYDIKIATMGFMASLVILLLVKYWQTRKWDKFLLISAGIGLLLGALTLMLDNPLFIQHKATAVYSLMALFFWISFKFFGKNWIEVFYSQMMSMSSKTSLTLLYGTICFFGAMAIANIALVASFSFDTWITIKTWGFLPITLIFALWQGWMIVKDKETVVHGEEKELEKTEEQID